ncbi:MAG: hypothetical protein J0H08_14775, partial [Rhizobiales bacterium]|nr:hypothetical protein [Hyphomicrobiales bacterium]
RSSDSGRVHRPGLINARGSSSFRVAQRVMNKASLFPTANLDFFIGRRRDLTLTQVHSGSF